MKSKWIILLIALAAAASLLAGCERPAPIPAGQATSTASIPFPIPEKPTLSANQMATQTAVAKNPPVVVLTPTSAGGQPQPTKAAQPQATQVPQATKAAQPTQAPQPTKKPNVFQPPPRPDNYTVQSGDNPTCIARRFNLNVSDLLSLNGIGASISPGQVLKLPQNSTWPSGLDRSLRNHPATYTVLATDTLNAIACKYGDVYPEAILAANNLDGPGDINPGMELKIP